MSMLTPPGMGGKYRIKGDRYPRMRRSRGRGKIILASVASVVAVAVIGWGTVQLIDIFAGGGSASASDDRAKPSDCTTPKASKSATAAKNGKGDKGSAQDGKDKGHAPGALPEPGSITVNVLNATSRGGLAKSTSDELKKRGFKIGDIGNAPSALDKKVKKTGVLVGAPGSDTTARLKVLGTQLDGADTKFVERDGKDVDLVLGDDFKKLTKKKAATAALAKLGRTTQPDKAPTAQPSPAASC
ncbi:LytR C-terminal domain-containing protein [Streptomyces iconiensis]|uniref:LytR C-terminal domain-containing protein n=1 Tax=Streptomyces iconiensis TaxID=1384038 RepID=A0ABT6ZRX5_9ACTN|nr:LytR C-terminal domain-containing protein [Streptomyces iconiensis]MDJ1131805.1 LytR C-terminal domain-containing protein [Streptomyces iconiensis]